MLLHKSELSDLELQYMFSLHIRHCRRRRLAYSSNHRLNLHHHSIFQIQLWLRLVALSIDSSDRHYLHLLCW
jgi:hypothetical protein